MPKNHHLLAVEQSLKAKADEKITAAYKTFQKPDLFNGHVKTWQPRAENQDATYYEMLPNETKNVQQNVADLLKVVREEQTALFDLTHQLNVTNTLSKADVIIDGVTVLKDAPATYLLWLRHHLDNMHTEIKKVPTLDPAEDWKFDNEQNKWASKPSQQIRTKKVEVPLVIVQATKEFPAQAKTIVEDVRTGTWTTIKHSSAMPVDRRDAILARVVKLQHAVKQALETANETEVPKGLASVGKAMFDFVLAE